jgi:hypothetical protein
MTSTFSASMRSSAYAIGQHVMFHFMRPLLSAFYCQFAVLLIFNLASAGSPRYAVTLVPKSRLLLARCVRLAEANKLTPRLPH